MDTLTKELFDSFIERYTELQNQKELLKQDEKDLFDEYKQKKLDTKTLKAAMRIVKIKQKVDHADTLEDFVEELTS